MPARTACAASGAPPAIGPSHACRWTCRCAKSAGVSSVDIALQYRKSCEPWTCARWHGMHLSTSHVCACNHTNVCQVHPFVVLGPPPPLALAPTSICHVDRICHVACHVLASLAHARSTSSSSWIRFSCRLCASMWEQPTKLDRHVPFRHSHPSCARRVARWKACCRRIRG